MDVSIIIVNYNTHQMTKDCIDSVFSKTNGLEYELILVDNASTDGSKDYFEKDSRIKYIYSNENLGFGRANNMGYKEAKGDFVFLLNSDTLILNNAIYEMFTYLRQSPKSVGCVGCEMVDGEGNPSGSHGVFPNVKYFLGRVLDSYKIRIPYLLGTTNKNLIYPLEVDYICGADLFIRREVIEKCGLFDPEFFMYYEETEMQFRFKKQGYLSHVIDTPQIMHFEGGSNKKQSGRRSLKVMTYEMRSRFLYAKKILSRKDQIIVSMMHYLLIPKILLYNSSWCEKVALIKVIIKS